MLVEEYRSERCFLYTYNVLEILLFLLLGQLSIFSREAEQKKTHKTTESPNAIKPRLMGAFMGIPSSFTKSQTIECQIPHQRLARKSASEVRSSW